MTLITLWEGKKSLYQTLPSPTIYTRNSHAYVTLLSVIDHFVAFDFTPDFMTPMDDITKIGGIPTCKFADFL